MTGERGFTLVEVLIAATLLVMSVLATLMLLDNATKTTAVSKQRDVANAVAQEMIERATGGRYTPSRNDMTDVDPAAALPGPADRMRLAMDPDGDQSSTAVSPATPTTGTQPVNVAQSWSLKRKNTTYTVSYRACTGSDTYQQVQIAGPFDCNRPASDPSGTEGTSTASGCGLGVVSAGTVDPNNPGQLTVKLQVLGVLGLSGCVGAVSAPLSNALCSLLGTSQVLNNTLASATGQLTSLLGGLVGGSVGLCPVSQVDQVAGGAKDAIGTSTRLAVTVAWTDSAGRARSIAQSAVIRRGET
jgi:Tfp pilus assembly protein PilV